MKYAIHNRWTRAVQFAAEIECADDTLAPIKIGLAVKWGRENGAVLRDADLRGAVLRGAVLRDADLSGAVLHHAILLGAVLRRADLRGAVLRGADLRGADLRDADLRGADLRDADLSDADLLGADLSGADLRDAVLLGADLRGADLRHAVLRHAVLSGADLRGAVLRDDAPVIPGIHQAVYAAASAEGALDMGAWHSSCGTAHCRAGWVVTLAGRAGKALEKKIGTPAAATAIYLASDPCMEQFPDFYCGNEEAITDMKARADAEAATTPPTA